MTHPTQTVRGGELARHYRDVRARLYGFRPVVIRVPNPAVPLAIEPPTEVAPHDVDLAEEFPQAPLNMLAAPSWRFLLTLAALRGGVSEEDIIGPRRAVDVVKARHDAMGLLYQHTAASLPRIGQRLGRDHTTVLHGLRKIGRTTKLVEVPDLGSCGPAIKTVLKPGSTRLVGAKAPKPPKPPKVDTPLQRAVKRAYKNQVKPSVVAEEYGCNPGSVKVIAHRLKLRRSDYRPKANWAKAETAGL